MAMASETTPLFTTATPRPSDPRYPLHAFLESKSPIGLTYERFTIFLILLSVLTFIFSSLFLPFNSDWAYYDACGETCDALWFGNYGNALSVLGLGNTSCVELMCVLVFTIDYLLRLYTCDLLDAKYSGFSGRIRYMFSFFALVDLVSIVPFYVDAFVLTDTDFMASNFVRMFRLLRMMRVEGRYDLALGMVDDVAVGTKGVVGIALFVGITVWGVMSSFFYIAERLNPDMIYCGKAPPECTANQDDIDTSLCTIDSWGVVDCTNAGCPPILHEDGTIEETCWSLYRSIISASFWTLCELFGEFPLMEQHSAWGQVLGTITTVFAAAIFALPAGIFGSGFEKEISKRREENKSNGTTETQVVGRLRGGIHKMSFVADSSSLRGSVYNFMYIQNTVMSKLFEKIMDGLVIATTIIFMFDTVTTNDTLSSWRGVFDAFMMITFFIYTIEYVLFMWSVGEGDPKFSGFFGMILYAQDFLRLVDLFSILPYFILMFLAPFISEDEPFYNFAKFCLMLRLFRFEKYSQAFTTFDDVIRENLDILTVTGFSAFLVWVLFSSILYLTERDSADDEMAARYKTVPHSMWITLLNLSGEIPLAHYSPIGKVLIGIIGLFATAIFGVPIGVLGAGFEELVEDQNEDTPDQEVDTFTATTAPDNSLPVVCYRFVNGIGSTAAFYFEMSVYILIATTVMIGIIQTVEGYEDAFSSIELLAVIVFTVEYLIRLLGVGADPEFAGTRCKSLSFVFSFYSIIDLCAIVPYYWAALTPGSWVDQHDQYFRMLRLVMLLKLDKYVPSITLIDDVIRLKRGVLSCSCFAAATLWMLFSGLMYLAEHKDTSMGIDNLPLYGCYEDCTESVRFEHMFAAIPLTGIHLTGDFPIIEYNGWGRIILFFCVIAAVGVVAIPSGVVASGFAEIVDSKNRASGKSLSNATGDDWFDIKYKELENARPPSSKLGANVDWLQYVVKDYLDGQIDEGTGRYRRTLFSKIARFFFLILIITNVLAVVMESVPEIDRAVGNQKGNFFDVFEAWSVLFFTIDYALRLFSARKSREALFSPWVYATTFFGIVDVATIAPWYIQLILTSMGYFNGDVAKIFRIIRIFRVLQLEDFVVAFSKLDNVFRASKDVLKATGLMAIIIWVGSAALFYLFESNNPNFRECDDSVPAVGTEKHPGCYDFESTSECNDYYPGMCSQKAFTNMPNALFYVAVFLGGEWGVVDFTWQGKLVCMFLCVAGIAIYSIPVGTLFDSFGAVIGLAEEEEEEEN